MPLVWGSLTHSSSSQSAADSLVAPAAHGLFGQRPPSPKNWFVRLDVKASGRSSPFASEDLIPSSLAQSASFYHVCLSKICIEPLSIERKREIWVLPWRPRTKSGWETRSTSPGACTGSSDTWVPWKANPAALRASSWLLNMPPGAKTTVTSTDAATSPQQYPVPAFLSPSTTPSMLQSVQ